MNQSALNALAAFPDQLEHSYEAVVPSAWYFHID
jgi:hypothetical protein